MTVFFNCSSTTPPSPATGVRWRLLPSVLSAIAGGLSHSRITGHITVPGWASPRWRVLFSSGVTLLGVGILSEYVARIFLQINQKPQSVVRQSTSAWRLAAAETRTESARQESSTKSSAPLRRLDQYRDDPRSLSHRDQATQYERFHRLARVFESESGPFSVHEIGGPGHSASTPAAPSPGSLLRGSGRASVLTEACARKFPAGFPSPRETSSRRCLPSVTTT